jgi:predicted flap endonuclease-1-like 5' DNA nuclease
MRTSKFLLVALLLIPVSSAFASHYYLEDASFIKAEEAKALKAEGLKSTETLLNGLITPDLRKAVSDKTKIKPARLRELAEFCDLLRVRGVGPKMATLLRLSGVMHTGDLAVQAGASLAKKLKAANDLHQISETLPEPGLLGDWIQQAQKLGRILR